MANLIGQDIGRYHIIDQLGQGGMATVYKAYDTRLDREVAIKLIRAESFGSEVSEQMLKRFEREAKSLAKMTHPNIVPIHDYGDYNGSPYLVMAYIPGGTLKNLTGKAMPYPQAARLIAPVAHALAYAHSMNIIHRDVKPANILITSSGQTMLSDFGVAKILESEDGNTLTGTGMGIGTPEYMAPEQWVNMVVPQTDIYALGVVFYELITGRKPYTADTPVAILIKQNNDPLPRPKQFITDLPDQVEQVIFKALAKKPEERYSNMEAFATALEKLTAQADTLQVSTPAVAAVAAPAARDKPMAAAPPTRSDIYRNDSSQPVQSVYPPMPASRGGIPKWVYWLAGVVVLGIIGTTLCVGGGLVAGLGMNSIATATPIKPAASTGIPSSAACVPPALRTESSGLITKVTMAEDIQGTNKDPVNPTKVFTKDATIHAVVAIKASANTAFKAVWYANDTNGAADCNTKIDETTLSTSGTRNIDFNLKPDSSWAVGSYRLEVYVDGTLDTITYYSIK